MITVREFSLMTFKTTREISLVFRRCSIVQTRQCQKNQQLYFSCRYVSASKANWTVESEHSMSKTDDYDLVLEVAELLKAAIS